MQTGAQETGWVGAQVTDGVSEAARRAAIRRRGWPTRGRSRRRGAIRSTRSNGIGATPSSRTSAARRCSSSAASSSRSSGRSRRPTSWCRSTSAARPARTEREWSVKQLIGRVVDTITGWAREQHYFASEADLQAFSDDLKHLLVYQKGSFNSPVWFNCGIEKHPQLSACFINSVEDTLDSILTLAQDRGHALQVRLRHGDQPVDAALVARERSRAAARRRARCRS